MNRISQALDFEDEYPSINLNFGLVDESFDIYQYQNNREKVYLYEMVSGANWVSCHIALFLSFLRYFSGQHNSPMPLIMFFYQPSQVYFPQGDDKNDKITQADLSAVNKRYKTIFDEINSIGVDTENLPQIIVVDHVYGNILECKDKFNGYVRCNWRNGKPLTSHKILQQKPLTFSASGFCMQRYFRIHHLLFQLNAHPSPPSSANISVILHSKWQDICANRIILKEIQTVKNLDSMGFQWHYRKTRRTICSTTF